MTLRTVDAAVLALGLTLYVAPGVEAQDPAATIEYRQNAMRMVAGHQNAIEALLEESVAPDSHIVPHARALADLSIMMPDLFPRALGGRTRARWM